MAERKFLSGRLVLLGTVCLILFLLPHSTALREGDCEGKNSHPPPIVCCNIERFLKIRTFCNCLSLSPSYVDPIPVCVKTVNTFMETLSDETKKDTKRIEDEFRAFCKKSKNKEQRFVSSCPVEWSRPERV